VKTGIILVCLLMAGSVLSGRDLRVVSLSPAHTEIIFRLGRGSLLTGRSSQCDRPAEVKRLPAAGNYAAPSLERLARIRPDLVISDTLQDMGMYRSMEAMKIRCLLLPLESFADYRRTVEILGRELDCPDDAAAEIARLDRTLAQLPPPPPKRPRVLFPVCVSPLILPGRRSFLGEYIRLCGGEPAGDTVDKEYFRASPEWVHKLVPEIIIFPGGKASGLPGWMKNLCAVRQGKVFFPEDEGLFFRFSPRFDQALQTLQKILHP